MLLTAGEEGAFSPDIEFRLDASVTQEACPLNLAPTSSTTVTLALGDALAMVLLEARGFSRADFAKFHPGGSLGRALLLTVEHVMRPRDQIAVVTPETKIADVLQTMRSARAGAAVVVNSDGTLFGIFTHGDFARHFQADPQLGPKAVGAFATKNPLTIRGNALAVEVLQAFERSRVDDLIVVDESSRPIGLVDTQDLTRLKLV